MHPRDVKGQPPVNGMHHGFVVNPKAPGGIQPVKLGPGAPVRLLPEPPREFRTEHLEPLRAAGEPHMVARTIGDAGKGQMAGVPLSFDHKSQSFMAPQQTFRGDHVVSTMGPVTNRGGTLQARAGFVVSGPGPGRTGFGSGGGYHPGTFEGGGGSYTGGSSHSGGGGAASSGGGGSSSGGGSGTSSHGSGGGAAVSSGGSSAGTSSPASSSSGAAPHH